MNVVPSWYLSETKVFGFEPLDHEARYDYAEEWIEILKLLWGEEDDFDYDGRYLQIKKGSHSPKPVQQPFPPIMQAGGSPRGREYAAKNADIAFTGVLADLKSA
jgi:alkanesulfonate monooxygenase SsuD/methylene tetrahydromethanopterin reductase-like flavin-dependent oxidoreductase (luciferase family)